VLRPVTSSAGRESHGVFRRAWYQEALLLLGAAFEVKSLLGFGCSIQGLEFARFRVQRFGIRVQRSGFRTLEPLSLWKGSVSGGSPSARFRVQHLGIRVYNLGVKV